MKLAFCYDGDNHWCRQKRAEGCCHLSEVQYARVEEYRARQGSAELALEELLA